MSYGLGEVGGGGRREDGGVFVQQQPVGFQIGGDNRGAGFEIIQKLERSIMSGDAGGKQDVGGGEVLGQLFGVDFSEEADPT
jgi:hypothetical protein